MSPLSMSVTCRTGVVCVYDGQDLPLLLTLTNAHAREVGVPLEYLRATGPAVRLFDEQQRETSLKRNPGDEALRRKWTRLAPGASVTVPWLLHPDEIEAFGGLEPDFGAEVVIRTELEVDGKVAEQQLSRTLQIGPHAGHEHAGPWSRAERGLRARLLVRDLWELEGTTTLGVFLELQNVSDVGTPMVIPWSFGAAQFTLRTAAGKPVEEAGLPRGGPQGVVDRLIIPYDGKLRWRVSVTGVALPQKKRWLIALPGQDWVIDRGDRTRYTLSARLEVTRQQDTSHDWHGVIELPPVTLDPSE